MSLSIMCLSLGGSNIWGKLGSLDLMKLGSKQRNEPIKCNEPRSET